MIEHLPSMYMDPCLIPNTTEIKKSNQKDAAPTHYPNILVILLLLLLLVRPLSRETQQTANLGETPSTSGFAKLV